MSIKKGHETTIHAGLRADGNGNIAAQDGQGMNPKSAGQVQARKSNLARGDSRYWLAPGKLLRKPGRSVYEFQFQIAGRRFTFSTRTGNREAGAKIAARIYSDFAELGVDKALRIHRTGGEREGVLTLGEWITQARAVFDGSPSTFTQYCQAARQIAADLLGVRRTNKRWGRKGGDYTEKADSAPLSKFSSTAIQSWRLRYVSERSKNPARARSARISCNTTLRSAKALFGEKIRKFLPPIEGLVPFQNVEFFPRESMRYQSKIDAGILLGKARDELAETRPEEFKALLLLLGAGLRRGEVDRLLWRQIDLNSGVIHVEVTEVGGLKSSDSSGDVSIDETLCGILRGFKARARGQFFLEGPDVVSGAVSWGQKYRCKETFESLVAWLREAGVEGHRPLHVLRKEAGSLIASRDGILAASRFLRHADIQVTAAHYADIKQRVTVDVGALLPPASTIPFADERPVEPAAKRRRRVR